jgi:hypothetical protein
MKIWSKYYSSNVFLKLKKQACMFIPKEPFTWDGFRLAKNEPLKGEHNKTVVFQVQKLVFAVGEIEFVRLVQFDND